MVAIWLVPVVLGFGGLFTAALGKPAFKWYTGEDGLVETLQVLLYAVALVTSALVVVRLRAAGERALVSLYLVVLVGLVFMLGEELSWGQRIFRIATSEHMREINRQGEENIHNITSIERIFKWFELLLGAYGTIPPILLRRIRGTGRLQRFFSFVVPHITLLPFFAPLFFWRIYRTFFPRPQRLHFFLAEFNEVFECVVAVGMALFMVYQWRRLGREARARAASAS